MKPIVDGLELDYGDQVSFRWLDAESEGRAAFTAFGLRGHPAFVIIDTAGEVLWKSVGEQPGSRLEAGIRQVLGEE
jgi:hypothetical protein